MDLSSEIENKKKSLIKSLIEKYRKRRNERNIQLHKISEKDNLMKIITGEFTYIPNYDSDTIINQCEIIGNMLICKNDEIFLNKYHCDKNKTNCNKKWNYHDNCCCVSEILLTTCFIRRLVQKNNLGLPREIWELICNFIENNIQFYIPNYFNFGNNIEIYLNKEKCFKLKEIFMKNEEYSSNCKIDPINVLKFINLGDIIIYGCNRLGFFFSIILDIDVKNKLITLIDDTNMNERSLRIENSKKKIYRKISSYRYYLPPYNIIIDLSEATITKIMNLHDFVICYGDTDIITYVWKTNLNL